MFSEVRYFYLQMPRLQEKLSCEVSKDAAIVACRFPLPDREPTMTVGEGIDTVWLYLSPKTVAKQTHDVQESHSHEIEKQNDEKS